MSEFDKYIVQGEPDKKAKANAWQTAIGLQDVDGLKPSEYLIKTAVQHIEGDITIDQVKDMLDTYYQTKDVREQLDDERTEEADKVSARITEILSEQSFSFTPDYLLRIHRRLFEGIYKHAGKLRDVNITKKEWVLNGDTVLYSNYDMLRETLEYDFGQEKKTDYSVLNADMAVKQICKFVSGIWQIHPFREGNTRTTAVFIIKYLRSLGFDVNNATFEKNSWYFRNALVRANYQNLQKGIYKETIHLERFFRNLLMGEDNVLMNRHLHIKAKELLDGVTPTSTPASTPSSVIPKSENVKRLISAIAENQLSVKEMMVAVGLKDRPNFIEYSLSPAMREGYVRMLYPDSPRHPRQKYMLTVKGLAVYKEMFAIHHGNS